MTFPILLLSCAFYSLTLQTFTIIGAVRNEGGQPVSGVRVSVTDESLQPIRTMFVDSSGRFQIQGLRSGTYLFRIETTGTPYEEQTQRHELQTIRLSGRGSEPYLIEFVLKLKKRQENTAQRELVFAQTVPEAAQAEYEHGLSSIRGNRSDQGVTALRKAIEIFPDYYLALELLGTEYVKRGEFEAALLVLTHAVEVNRAAPRSLYSLGVAYLKLDRWTEAIDALRKAAELDPGNANVYMMLGLAYGHTPALEQAEAAFRKAYQLGGRQVAEAHFYLAGIYNKQEKYHEARQELELYLKEAKDIDRNQVREMIEKLRAKEKAKK
ncbi:MAG TPA: tetratricopeptide repeat protein [Blastocatellia bacterium]|nr:tetratricopeptide repeat protein [Blastocatellia bacterium]